LHVKTNHRKPLSFYFLIATVLMTVCLSAFAYTRFDKRFKPQVKEQSGGAQAQAIATPLSSQPENLNNALKHAFPDYKPAIENLPESAPAYAELIKVTDYPHLMGCVRTPDFCRCYTTQGTPYQVSDAFCGEYLKGNYFNPYKQQKKPEEQQIIQASSKKNAY
jgi:zona occludens toxin